MKNEKEEKNININFTIMWEAQWNNIECNVPSEKEKGALWIRKLTKELLKGLWNSITNETEPTPEQIKDNIARLRGLYIEEFKSDIEYVEHLKTAKFIYVWNWAYWKESFDNPWNIWWFNDKNNNLLVNISEERNTYPQEYKDILKYLEVTEEYDKETEIYHMYELDCWKKWKEIKQDTEEYFKLFMKIAETWVILSIRDSIKLPKPIDWYVIIERWLKFRVVTFRNIEAFLREHMMKPEEFEYAKKEIPKFFFRLVYVGLVKTKEEVIDAEKYFEDKELYKKSVKEWNRQHPGDEI